MAEIKSSIELAMERTRGLTFTDEEKRRLEEEKVRRAAQALAARYLQGDLSHDELARHEEALEGPARQTLLHALVTGLKLGNEAFNRGMTALEHWKGKEGRQPLNRLRDLSGQFGHALQKKRRKAKSELWETLASRGVEGSAVEPNVEDSTLWKATVEALEREFEPRLQELRRALLTQLKAD